ncbi:hypothetical protein [Sulfuricurvum sp.]|uniref:hypothetical protein n=1 Tax=Sulfuricurvum sp. TaxID=2025608 RepID=UPI003BB09DDD
MFDWLKTYLIGILVTLLVVSIASNGALWYMNDSKQEEINKLNVNIGVTAALSQQQQVKVVESKVIEEKIHVITNDKLKTVKEYVYDQNKSDCDNGIAIMRGVF